MRLYRWRVVVLSVAVALAMGLVSGFVAGAVVGRSRSSNPPRLGSGLEVGAAPAEIERMFDTAEPLFIDVSSATTLAKAQASSPYAVATPSSMPTSVTTKSPEVWFSTNTNELGLRYGNQVVILERAWASGQDPVKEYAAEADAWGGQATVLGGKPAWIVSASEGAYPDINMVHVSVGGVDITVFAKTSLSEAESIAGSMGTK